MRAIPILALALAFVPSSSATSVRTACGLLTNTDVGKVMGVGVADRSSRADTCTWTSLPRGAYDQRVTLTVGLQRMSSRNFQIIETQAKNVTHLRNLGTRAFVMTLSKDPAPQLWVSTQGFLLEISASPGQATVNAETAAARFALKRL